MKFCSECKSMLIPKEEGSDLLKCPECGNEEKLDEEQGYKIEEENKNQKTSEVAVVEEEKEKKIREPEYEIDDDVKAEVLEETY